MDALRIFAESFLAWCNIAAQMISAVFEAHVPALRESLLALCGFFLEMVFPPTPPTPPIPSTPPTPPTPPTAPGPAPSGANLNREHLLQGHQAAQANSTALDGLVALASYNQALGQLLHERIQHQGVQIGGLVLQGEEHAQQIQETSESLHGVQSRVVSLEREGRNRDMTIKRLICGIVLGLVSFFLKK